MSKFCFSCGKGPRSGKIVSHANNRIPRRWLPNLQKVRIITPQGRKKVWVCTQCLKQGKVTKVF